MNADREENQRSISSVAAEAQAPNRVPIIALLTSNSISLVGSQITFIAIPWFVLESTGSPAKTGLSAAFMVLPMVVSGVFGGAVVDRLGFKRASIISDLASGVTVALIPLLYVTVGLPLAVLVALVFLGAILDVPGGTARLSMIPELAATAGARLERVNAASETITRGAQLAGPLVAGVLIAFIGPTNVLWIDAVTFGVSATVVAAAIPTTSSTPSNEEERQGYLTGLAEGWRFVYSTSLLRTLLLVSTLINFILAPLLSVVLPVYVSTTYGHSLNLGVMLAAFAGGTLAGTILYGVFSDKLPRQLAYLGGILVSAAAFPVLIFSTEFIAVVAALVIMGLGLGPVDPILLTVAHERVPPDLRGRFFGVMTSIAFVVMPPALFLIGFLIQSIGLSTTLTLMVSVYLVSVVCLLFSQTLRSMDEPHVVEYER